MTEPATLPGDDVETIRSGGHDGQVYVHNPVTGKTEATDPATAADRVYAAGWVPVSKDDATRIDAHALLKQSITPGQSVEQGLTRGLTGGLSDLLPRTDDQRRLEQATDEEFPWLTPISEGAGFLAPFGVGAGLGKLGGAITTGLRGGEELGLLGRAATRAAGMGAEGAAYGGIGAARESQIQDDPLTAQKLMSGMFGGALVGGALGGGVGALEGSGSLIRKMFHNTSAEREALSAPGLRDSDISPILERAGQAPLQPGALQELQALLYNDANVTPEALAAISKSPGIKEDMFLAGHERRAVAEGQLAKALNDLHGGNQDALDGWQGRLKRDKIEHWIGPEREHVSDAGNLVEMLKMLDVRGRFNLSQDIVEAVERAGGSNPEAFAELMNSVSATNKKEALRNIDRALLHGDKNVLDQLFSSKLLNDENIAGLKIPQPEPAELSAVDKVKQLGVENADFNRDPESMRDMSNHRGGYAGASPDEVQAIARGERPTKNSSSAFAPVKIHVESDGQIHLNDGRHRLLAAQEAGASEISALVRSYDAEGNLLSEHVQPLNIKALESEAGVTRALDPAEAQAGLRKALRLPERAEKIEPMWKSKALDYVDRNIEQLDELLAQPQGYVAGKGGGKIKKMRELMSGARKSIEEGDRANAFGELDYVKKRVGAVRAEVGDRVGTGQAAAAYAQDMHEQARLLLEDSGVWGVKAASAQKEMNVILHEHFNRASDFKNAFFSGAGVPDPKNQWAEKLVADPAKIRSAMDRVVNPERSLELQTFKAHIGDSSKLADMMEKYYQPDEAQNAVIKSMREGSVQANKSMDDALHYAMRINQGKILAGVAHGSARGMAAHVAGYALGGPLGVAGSVMAQALVNPGRVWRMQAIVERMLGAHKGRFADGIAGIIDKGTKALAGVASKAPRALGGAGLLAQDVAQRQTAYSDTLHDLAAMASNRDVVVKALSSWHGPDLAHMPNVIPTAADALQRAAQFCLQVAPARPQPGMFSDDALGLITDSEAEEFSNTVHAAFDPMSVLSHIQNGRLTPQVLEAAETAAPELVDDLRQEVIQIFTNTSGKVKISAVHQQGLSLLLGVQASPMYVAALQKSWADNLTAPTAKVTVGNIGDTGVNERYAKSTYSAADRIESGEQQP